MVNFFKKLFAGGGGQSGREMMVYVRPKMCKEILAVRIDLFNSLSQAQDGYYLRKLARGARCPFEVEMEFHFNDQRRVVSQNITNGEFVDKATYDAFIAEQA
jgi:hypothetical protein